MTIRTSPARALVIVAALAASCGEETLDANAIDAGAVTMDASARDAGSSAARDASFNTERDARVDTEDPERCDRFAEPFDRAGKSGRVIARFITVDPLLVYRGRYDWTVELRTPAGAAIGDAELKAKAFMPAHGHGTSTIRLQHTAGSAQYDLLGVNLFMAGKWEVTLTVTSSAGDDQIEFRACPKELPDAGSSDLDAGDDAGDSTNRGRH